MIDYNLNVAICALTVWRENRGGGISGMQSVTNAIANRVKKHGTSLYEECIKPKQFSSMTVPGPEAILFPSPTDPQMTFCLSCAKQAADGTLADMTKGATVYYNPNGIISTKTYTRPDTGEVVRFPEGWNPVVLTFTGYIAGHLFFVEK